MSIRKLASVRTIDRIVPHKNANRLEVAIVGGWPTVVPVGLYQEGQRVVFCEVDSLLPRLEQYSFLKGSEHVEPDGTEWYRVRTNRVRGQMTQGVLLPAEGSAVGTDVTKALGIRKYERPLPAGTEGVYKGGFPTFIPKTDQERVQNLTLRDIGRGPFVRSEKLDGSSCTVYALNGHVGVCSRNRELEQLPGNRFWEAAQRCGVVEAVGRHGEMAIQGEVIGPGIQGNKYGLHEHRFYAFDIYSWNREAYESPFTKHHFCTMYQIPMVPLLPTRADVSIQEIIEDAPGKSALAPSVEREGVVWGSLGKTPRVSFKAISNKFLEKYKE